MIKGNNIINLCFLVLILVSGSSCSNNEEPIAIASDGTMIAKVDGVNWQSTSAAAVIHMGRGIVVTGMSAEGEYLTLYASGSMEDSYVVSGGSVSFDNSVEFTPAGFDAKTNPNYTSTHLDEANVGEIVITEIDSFNKTISGTFRSRLKRFTPQEKIIKIVAGTFTKVPYEYAEAADNSFSANINGSSFSSAHLSTIHGLGTVKITFTGGGNIAMTIKIPDSINTGTFNLSSYGSDYYVIYTESATVSYESVSGSIVITKHDKTSDRIEGTFNFDGELFPYGGGSLVVTDGSFAISY